MKITPADKWFSFCVRERAEWKCERCGKQYVYPTTSQGLDCAHYQTRSEWATRFDPFNAFALCRGCHGYFDSERRFEFEEFYLEKMGEEKLAVLRLLARSVDLGKEIKHTKGCGDIANHFRFEYHLMLSKRATGITGRMEFERWQAASNIPEHPLLHR